MKADFILSEESWKAVSSVNVIILMEAIFLFILCLMALPFYFSFPCPSLTNKTQTQ